MSGWVPSLKKVARYLSNFFTFDLRYNSKPVKALCSPQGRSRSNQDTTVHATFRPEPGVARRLASVPLLEEDAVRREAATVRQHDRHDRSDSCRGAHHVHC